ncbi:MAG: NAD-dependent epimerase/dehydratase family protein, partial [bacterium]|nr:NAD-dependent epimerase/dehydratase family protein [bacterium]
GGAGFIGSHVVDALIDKGLEVIVVDDLSSGKMDNINPAASFCRMSIADDGIEALVLDEAPDYIFHLAAQIDVRRSTDDPDLYMYKANYGFDFNEKG